jgi:ribosomal protein S18 acetylase RimI-like enzyme
MPAPGGHLAFAGRNEAWMRFEELFRIRLCHKEDAPVLAPLVRALAIEEGAEAAGVDEIETVISALLQSGVSDFLLATIAERPVGCLQIAYRLSTWEAAPYAYVEDFYLAPEARARGIGTKMLDYALQRAEGQRSAFMSLDVRTENRAAQRLYARFGFKESGSILLKRPLPLGETYACEPSSVAEASEPSQGTQSRGS